MSRFVHTSRRLLPVAVFSLASSLLAVPVAAASSGPGQPSEQPTTRPTDQSGAEDASAIATLHQVRPSVVTPASDTLTFSGSVTNSGDVPLEKVQVLPRYSAVPLEERAEIRQIADDDDLYRGVRSDDAFAELGRLAPGESAAFELTVPVTELGFGQAGIYAAGVDVRGTSPDDERLDLDTERTVVPWLPDLDQLATVPVALLWPVTARPSLLPGGDLIDDAVSDAVSDGGYLAGIVAAGAEAAQTDRPLSWMIDPDLLTTVGVMADGYAVDPGDGDPTPGSGDTAAATWRRSLDEAVDGAYTAFLPAARPDLDAAAETDANLVTDLAQQAVDGAQDATQTQGVSARTDVVWADGPGLGEAALTAWTEAGARTVILPADSVDPPASGREARVALGDDRVDAVLTDPGLDAAIADADAAAEPQAGVLDLQQRWLAETAMVALEAAEDDDAIPTLVAAPPQRWTPAPEIASAVVQIFGAAPWVSPIDLDAYAPAGEAADVELTADAVAEALPAANLEATATLSTEASHYTSMLADAGDRSSALAGATLRSASTGWRDDPAAGEAYTSTVVDELTNSIDRVSVTVPETVTLSSSRGAFPLTVTNDLDEPVVVRLDVHADNVNRLKVEEVPPQRVEAGEKASITVTAQASSNGKVPIQVQLIAGDGAPLGEPQRMVVTATDYGTLGWIIVAAAGGVFALALVKRLTGRRRSRADEAPADGDTPAVPSDPAERVAP